MYKINHTCGEPGAHYYDSYGSIDCRCAETLEFRESGAETPGLGAYHFGSRRIRPNGHKVVSAPAGAETLFEIGAKWAVFRQKKVDSRFYPPRTHLVPKKNGQNRSRNRQTSNDAPSGAETLVCAETGLGAYVTHTVIEIQNFYPTKRFALVQSIFSRNFVTISQILSNLEGLPGLQ